MTAIKQTTINSLPEDLEVGLTIVDINALLSFPLRDELAKCINIILLPFALKIPYLHGHFFVEIYHISSRILGSLVLIQIYYLASMVSDGLYNMPPSCA